VSLRDVSQYRDWIDREQPSEAARRVAAEFLLEVADRPWAAPSVPLAQLSDQPNYEVREALLPVPGDSPLRIYYRHVYATDHVDVIAVTNQ
jgi:hypothetical protein